MSEIIAICNQKGGVGKTTTTISLGAYLAAFGRKVLLVDFDAQSNTTSGLGFDYKKLKKTVYNTLVLNDSPQETIYKTSVFGLHLLPASPDLIGAQVELNHFDNKEFRLAQILSSIAQYYNYILIDLPPSLGVLTINGLVAANQVLIPIQAEYYALEGLSQLITTIDLIRRNLEKDLHILGAILTLYDKRNRLDRMVAKHLRRNFPGYVFDITIPRNISLAEAPSFGKPIIQYNPYSEGARAYQQLAKELIQKVEFSNNNLKDNN
ncbi:MAG: ParA family protein [Candidatus Pacebacteria bacterium]|jgi:chromosome partitioning protein|nr:ParA family protein [Candidatus Paceibacterota bacterium]MDD4994692.1 ParA family protein [Candidatus Paceibacterota bacterium]MDD5535387.1 ParA family protein [Candidatus Paceibacterota bacterium]